MVSHTKDNDICWKHAIFDLLNTLYTNGNKTILLSLLVFIYEYSVWKAHVTDEGKVNLKDLKRLRYDEKWSRVCSSLYAIHNTTVHEYPAIFNDPRTIVTLLSSQEFPELLKWSFGNDSDMFDELLYFYSKWVF